MALMGVSSLGVTFGYGVESTVGQKPGSFTQLTRINSLGGINIEPNTVDASALEDMVDKTVAGRASTGGTFPVTINFTSETYTEWTTLISTYQALTESKQMWFQTIIPGFTNAFFVVAQPPALLPQPKIGQNELMTMEINLTIVDYKGMDTKVAFS